MSNVIAKSHRDHQGSQSEQLWTLVTIQGMVLSLAISTRLRFDWRLRHNAFRNPGLRTFRLLCRFIVASQRDGNPAFTVHAERYIAHAFRAATKLKQSCYQGCAEGGSKTGDVPGHPRQWVIETVKLQEVHFIKIL